MLPLLVLPALLASCNMFGKGLTSGDISGKISNIPSGSKVKIAVIGVSEKGIDSEAPAQALLAVKGDGLYSATLPKTNGLYNVIGFVDANDNNTYEIGERRTKVTGKYLALSDKGWSIVNVVVPTAVKLPITNYDLSF